MGHVESGDAQRAASCTLLEGRSQGSRGQPWGFTSLFWDFQLFYDKGGRETDCSQLQMKLL